MITITTVAPKEIILPIITGHLFPNTANIIT